jgi:WD40 repeat protein
MPSYTHQVSFNARRIVVVQRDRKNHKLSAELVKFNLGSETSDVPYRMKLHPSGKALVVSNALGGIKVVRIDRKENEALPILSPPLPSVAKAAEKCSFVGTVKSLSFTSDGTLMALGADDGKVHIMSWPTLDKKGVIDVTKNTTKGVRSVDFSSAHDDRVLIAVDEWGSCFLYDIETLKVVHELEKPGDMPRMAMFRVVSRMEEGSGIVLYGAGNCNKKGYVMRWKQHEESFKLDKISKAIAPSPFCGWAMSHDGATMAAVTPDAEQCVVSTETLKRVKLVKGAHMTFATAVGYTEEDDAIVSVSADGSAVLTDLQGSGVATVLTLLILTFLLAVAALLIHFWGRETMKKEPEKTLNAVDYVWQMMADLQILR